MNRKEYIQQYVANNPNPDQKYCPDLVLYYKGNAAKYGGPYVNFYRVKTGQKFINNNPFAGRHIGIYNVTGQETELMLTPNQFPNCCYIKHIVDESNDINMIEVSTILINNSRPDRNLNSDRRTWEYVHEQRRWFLFKGDATPYGIDGEPTFVNDNGKYYNHQMMKVFNNFKYTNMIPMNAYQMREFAYGSGEWTTAQQDAGMMKLNSYWHMEEFYRLMIPRLNDAKKAETVKLANQTTLTSFEDIKKQRKLSVTKTVQDGHEYVIKPDHFWYIDQDAEKNVYFRCIATTPYVESADIKALLVNVPKEFDYDIAGETCRIIVTPKNKITYLKYNSYNKKFEHSSQKFDRATGYRRIWLEDLEKLSTIDNLKSYVGMLENVDPRERVNILLQAIRHPLLNKFFDAGYDNIANSIDPNYFDSNIKKIFNIDKIKKGSLEEITELNTYQLGLVNELAAYRTSGYGYKAHDCHYWDSITKALKEVLGAENVNKLTDKESKEWFEGAGAALTADWRGFRALVSDAASYYWAKKIDYTEEQVKTIKELIKKEQATPGYMKAWGETKTYLNRLQVGYKLTEVPKLSMALGELVALKDKAEENLRCQWSRTPATYK